MKDLTFGHRAVSVILGEGGGRMCEQRIVMKRWKKIPNYIEEKMKKPVFITIEEKNVNMPMPLQSEACGIKDENCWIVEMIQPDSD